MALKTQSTNRRNKSTSDIECLDVCDNKVSSIHNLVQYNTTEKLTSQNQACTSSPRGLTPPINGEHYTVKKSYAMIPSTVRKLDALKSEQS